MGDLLQCGSLPAQPEVPGFLAVQGAGVNVVHSCQNWKHPRECIPLGQIRRTITTKLLITLRDQTVNLTQSVPLQLVFFFCNMMRVLPRSEMAKRSLRLLPWRILKRTEPASKSQSCTDFRASAQIKDKYKDSITEI